MIKDLLQVLPDASTITDVCIVGAGAAGITLAVELARLGQSVTLLEGGGAAIESESQTPYASDSGGLPHRGLHTGRFRAMGGTTTMWGGQILPLQTIDFSPRPWVPESGWPLTLDELQPHYARALELEGLGTAHASDEAVWKALGEPHPPSFAGLDYRFSRWCPEPNFARLHRHALDQSPNLQAWIHANVVEVLLDGDTVRGVRCRTLSSLQAVFRARRFVFALGAIECSRFFLQPRTGRLPWNDSGLLGMHFQDHVDSDAATLVPRNPQKFRRAFDTVYLSGYKYAPKLILNEALQREARVLNVGATVYAVSEEDEAIAVTKQTAKEILRGRLRQLDRKQLWTLARHSPLLLAQAYRYAIEHRAYHPASATFRLRVHCEQEPASTSAITLSDQRDALGLLKTRLTWQISAAELQTVRCFVEHARSSLLPIADVHPHPALYDSGEKSAADAFLAQCQDSFHHMGGMRMSSSPARGVVDPDLKLNGTRNCFICSSAVFPSSGFSNPTHTLLALAVRLSQHLAEEAKRLIPESGYAAPPAESPGQGAACEARFAASKPSSAPPESPPSMPRSFR